MCAQLSRSTRSGGCSASGRSYTGSTLQPAAEQWGQLAKWLVAIGQQGQLTVTLGQQGREAGNPQVLDPGEIRRRGGVLVGTVEGRGEFRCTEWQS